jgi:hypothetical protein
MIKPFNNNPFAFFCYLEKEGYEWAGGKFDLEKRLVGRGGLGSQVIISGMRPGVFLEFADLDQKPESIREFANRYGNLFEDHDLGDWIVERGRILGGSTLKKWSTEIGDMHCLVGVWEAIKNNRKKELAKIITWAKGGVRYEIRTPKPPIGRCLPHPAHPHSQMQRSRFRPGDVLGPARYAFQAELNRRISSPESLTPPRLVWTRKLLGPGLPERVGELVLVFTPPSLLAAMWLQFAQAVSGRYDIRQCQGCGKHFMAGPGARRPGAKTCNDTCRQRRHRRLKQEIASSD